MSIAAMSLETHRRHKDPHITVEGKARWQSLSNMTLPNSPHLKLSYILRYFIFPLVKDDKMSLQNCKEDVFTSGVHIVTFLKKKFSGFNLYDPHDGIMPVINPLKPSDYFMYRQFKTKTSQFCPHSVFISYIWLTSLYRTHKLLFRIETHCFLWGTTWNFTYNAE
jgi:hypothetical protein